MTTHWTIADLPATAWDPEPDDEDNGPWCPAPASLWRQSTPLHRLDTATTITPAPEYL